MREAPDTEPGAGEVRIAVRAVGVNFADVLGRLGLYPDAPKPPFILGYEVCGTVDAVGSASPGFRPAIGCSRSPLRRIRDRVVVPAGLAFRRARGSRRCRGGRPARELPDCPPRALQVRQPRAGETVLIHNAAGGVGIAAIQLARLRGATVIGTASATKHDAIRSFGVEHAIDYRTATSRPRCGG